MYRGNGCPWFISPPSHPRIVRPNLEGGEISQALPLRVYIHQVPRWKKKNYRVANHKRSRSPCLDRSLECAAMEWNGGGGGGGEGEACTFGEKAFTHCRIIDVSVQRCVSQRTVHGMLCSVCVPVPGEIGFCLEDIRGSTGKRNERPHQPPRRPLFLFFFCSYCSSCGNILFPFSEFYFYVPARSLQRARDANIDSIYLLIEGSTA